MSEKIEVHGSFWDSAIPALRVPGKKKGIKRLSRGILGLTRRSLQVGGKRSAKRAIPRTPRKVRLESKNCGSAPLWARLLDENLAQGNNDYVRALGNSDWFADKERDIRTKAVRQSPEERNILRIIKRKSGRTFNMLGAKLDVDARTMRRLRRGQAPTVDTARQIVAVSFENGWLTKSQVRAAWIGLLEDEVDARVMQELKTEDLGSDLAFVRAASELMEQMWPAIADAALERAQVWERQHLVSRRILRELQSLWKPHVGAATFWRPKRLSGNRLPNAVNS